MFSFFWSPDDLWGEGCSDHARQRSRVGLRAIVSVMLGGVLLLGTGCRSSEVLGSGETPSQAAGGGELHLAVVRNFPAQVVIPTYTQLVERSAAMVSAVDALVATPDATTLKAAQVAWLAARSPWEQSEAFAFGPADSLGFDGDLDDWPVNETDVQAVLQDNSPITPEAVQALQTTQKGFHTLEFLLFGADNNRQAADLTPRKLEYLQALTLAFDQTAQDLLRSWRDGIGGNPAYSTVLATAGDGQNTAYPTAQTALAEIVQGMMGCLDEVGNEKIGEPLKAKSTDGLESRFSHSSLADFKNNLMSAQNAYLGRAPGATQAPGESLSDVVAQADPELDKQLKAELEQAIAALEAVPNPVEPQLTNPETLAKLEAAKGAVLTAFETVEGRLLPLVQDKG